MLMMVVVVVEVGSSPAAIKNEKIEKLVNKTRVDAISLFKVNTHTQKIKQG